VLFDRCGASTMFWLLLFAHFLADYPFQPDRLVAAKRSWIGQVIHAFIHLVVTVILVGAVRTRIWPALIVLTFTHLMIDIGKSALSKIRPQWVVAPYFIDQLLHIVSIWIVAQWISTQIPETLAPDTTRLIIYGIAYLITTIVWYVSERMITWANPQYRTQVQEQSWSRMISRAVLFSLFLFLLGMAPFQGRIQSSLLVTAAIPYLSGQYRLRPFLTDVGVALVGVIFVSAAL